MISFQSLAPHPRAFASLSGMNRTDFEALYQDFASAYAQDRQNSPTRAGQPRKRAAGGGSQFSQEGRTRLLMTLVWLRVYPTYEVLAFFFGLHRGNAHKGVVEVLATLAAHTVFVCERPAAERKKLRSVQAVMDAFPDVRLIIDAKEQRIQRPGGTDEDGNSHQKPFYSGKKKTHTLKTQVAVSPDGRFQSVSQSVPGSVHDLTLLRRSDLMYRLDRDEAAMLDKGYDGITTLDPKNPDKNGPSRTCYLPYKARRGHPLTPAQKAYNAHLASYRIVVEHSLAQMTQFQSLAQVYRHDRAHHSLVTRVVAGLVNRRIAKRPLKVYA
jgi:DDE superfamily endonuclease/Helix-turn-helix of DDE superfamily endonuclease